MTWSPKFTFSVTWDNITDKPLNYPTTWSLVAGKPSTFPSTWATVSGKPTQATRWPSWSEVTGKPSTFAPSSHTHTIADVTGLQAGLNAKFDSPSGTTSHYVRGDGSLATFPSIPTSSAYVATSGNQNNLSGHKTWTGEHYHEGDVHIGKTNAALSLGVDTSTTSGGIANYGNPGIGDVGLFSEYSGGTVRLRPNGRNNAGGQLLVTLDGVSWQGHAVYHEGNPPPLSTNLSAWDGVTVASKADSARTITAGNGLSGGGSLAANRTITLGTPGTISGSTTNSVTTSSHTHSLDTSSDYSWGGRHEFSGPVHILDNNLAFASDSNSHIWFRDSNINTRGLLYSDSSNNRMTLRSYSGSTFKDLAISHNGTFTWDDNTVYHSGNLSLSDYALASRSISAGNGLSGGGTLAANRTLTLATPGAVTLSSTNSVATSSHTHAFTPGGTTSQYIRGNGSLATFPTIPSNFVATSGNQTGLAGNKSWTGSHTHSQDLLVAKTNAVIGVGISAVNGGIANYGNQGTGQVGFFSNFSGGTLYFRPNGRTSGTGGMTLSSNGNLSVSGAVTATNVTAPSDPRLKDDIKKVKARRELIEKLEYYSFKWKRDGTVGRSIMADKVQEIAPDHVLVGDDAQKTLSVDKGALALEMVFALIDMLKEQGNEFEV